MKKIISTIIGLFFLTTGTAFADCEIGLAWTPDPLAVNQMVYHNPDGVVDNGDEILKATLSGFSDTQYQWLDVGACPANNKVYVTTEYSGGLTIKSPELTVSTAVGAILTNSVKIEQ